MLNTNTGGQVDFPRQLTHQDEFYRAINPIYVDKRDGKVSPGAFAKTSKTNAMSVDWAELSTPRETYDRWEKWGDRRRVASITARLIWDNKQNILFTETECNPSHSEVVDGEGAGALSKNQLKKNLLRGAKLLI